MTMLAMLTRRRCRQVAKVLQAYLDGEADPTTAQAVHAHLEVCRRCGLEARTYRAIKAAIPPASAPTSRVEVDPTALARLRLFAEHLGDDDEDSQPS
jgi:anti-sigma factor RsiW